MDPDEILIRETLGGNLSSFDELMRRYEHLVFKIAYGFVGGRENALDVTQTVFLKAFQNLSTFRTDCSFKTWLLRITYNEGINWTRSPRNRRVHDNIEPASDAPCCHRLPHEFEDPAGASRASGYGGED